MYLETASSPPESYAFVLITFDFLKTVPDPKSGLGRQPARVVAWLGICVRSMIINIVQRTMFCIVIQYWILCKKSLCSNSPKMGKVKLGDIIPVILLRNVQLGSKFI